MPKLEPTVCGYELPLRTSVQVYVPVFLWLCICLHAFQCVCVCVCLCTHKIEHSCINTDASVYEFVSVSVLACLYMCLCVLNERLPHSGLLVPLSSKEFPMRISAPLMSVQPCCVCLVTATEDDVVRSVQVYSPPGLCFLTLCRKQDSITQRLDQRFPSFPLDATAP